MIEIKDLHFSYKRKKIFNGLNLTLQPGYIYGFLGKNGTGKTTLLRNISGLVFPSQGKVKVLGFDPRERRPAFLQELFMVPEEFYLPDVSIAKFVDCNASFYPKFSEEQFDRYLKEFDIPLSNKLQQMSYGQKKKVLIAFGLACNTSLLLMDEPTNGLDIISKSQFRKTMATALQDNKCILISTHQVKDLENLIDRITIIDEGKILFDKTLQQLSARLNCKVSYDNSEIKNALYREPAMRGEAIIQLNMDGEEGKIDLEMLYKAVVLNGDVLKTVFNN